MSLFGRDPFSTRAALPGPEAPAAPWALWLREAPRCFAMESRPAAPPVSPQTWGHCERPRRWFEWRHVTLLVSLCPLHMSWGAEAWGESYLVIAAGKPKLLSCSSTSSKWAVVQQLHVVTPRLVLHHILTFTARVFKYLPIIYFDRLDPHWRCVLGWNGSGMWVTVMFSSNAHCWALDVKMNLEKGRKGIFWWKEMHPAVRWTRHVWRINDLLSHDSFSTNHRLNGRFYFKLEFPRRCGDITLNDNTKWWVSKCCAFYWKNKVLLY